VGLGVCMLRCMLCLSLVKGGLDRDGASVRISETNGRKKDRWYIEKG
jgi:hypothetical protein